MCAKEKSMRYSIYSDEVITGNNSMRDIGGIKTNNNLIQYDIKAWQTISQRK